MRGSLSVSTIRLFVETGLSLTHAVIELFCCCWLRLKRFFLWVFSQDCFSELLEFGGVFVLWWLHSTLREVFIFWRDRNTALDIWEGSQWCVLSLNGIVCVVCGVCVLSYLSLSLLHTRIFNLISINYHEFFSFGMATAEYRSLWETNFQSCFVRRLQAGWRTPLHCIFSRHCSSFHFCCQLKKKTKMFFVIRSIQRVLMLCWKPLCSIIEGDFLVRESGGARQIEVTKRWVGGLQSTLLQKIHRLTTQSVLYFKKLVFSEGERISRWLSRRLFHSIQHIYRQWI